MNVGLFRLLMIFAWMGCRSDDDEIGKNLPFFPATDKYFRYTGRVDFTNPSLPRFWSPGVYIETRFQGSECVLLLNDEQAYGNNNNYVQLIVDGKLYKRVKTSRKKNVIEVARGLDTGVHTLLICKGTEAGIGYLEFEGLKCNKLLPPARAPSRRIEFIGNSVTCGTGSDLTAQPCGTGQWYDQHNAFYAYGPTTARKLRAQWHLTSVSGIGLMKSCCNMDFNMPEVYDKVSLGINGAKWKMDNYHPDVITVCLGQNDGMPDSRVFQENYKKFVRQLRRYHPAATIIFLNSPMANEELAAYQRQNLNTIRTQLAREGMKKIHTYYFKKRYHNGCGDHPDLNEHQAIANELVAAIANVMNW